MIVAFARTSDPVSLLTTLSTFSVCIDDSRECGTVNVKDPRAGLTVLRRLHKQMSILYMDNDMGHGWEFEGRNILRQFLVDCRNAKHYVPQVMIVTSNCAAREAMIADLTSHGYRKHQNDPRWMVRG